MSLRVALLVAALALPTFAAQPDTAPIPIETFFGLPNIISAEVSPDGKKVAFLVPANDHLALAVYDIATHDATVVVHPTDENIQGYFWKGNDCLVFYADVGGNEVYFVGSVDLKRDKIRRIFESTSNDWLMGATGGIIDALKFDPDHIVAEGIFTERHFSTTTLNRDFIVAKVNVRNGSYDFLMQPESNDAEYLTDNTGAIRLRKREVLGVDTWDVRPPGDDRFYEATHFKHHGYAEDWVPLAFAADNVTLYVLSRTENDRGGLYTYDTATRKMGEALFIPPAGEILRPILSYDRKKLYGVEYETDKPQYFWVDPERAKVQAKLERTFAGEVVEIVSQSADETVAMVLVHSDRNPGIYFLFDRKVGTLALFKRVRDIDPRRLQPMEPITFTARDGVELHGYLTLPAGAKGKRVPLIIHPHGGPFGIRDTWGYDREVQFLASRGYAVLQVNYRGSGGYGRAFIDKGRYQWGRAMQDDLTDAVHWAIDRGIADPARVAIYGASYGGYAALAGVTLTPDLYCCAVNYVGPSDLTMTFNPNSAYHHTGEYDYQRDWVGKDAKSLDETSPINFIDRIKVPTLHAYGDNDPRVKIKHWQRLEPVLKKYHKQYIAIEEPNQGHGFRDAKASIKFYHAMEDFFAKYLAPERPETGGTK
jgi:dipeptidyl aminopeptidase/acylaminoacyl peptidase